MIRILIAEALSSKIIEKLNEIPEFEILGNTIPTPEKLAAEIKNVDALVMNDATLLPAAAIAGAASLKIIVLTGAGANQMEPALAKQTHVEIRSTTPIPVSSVVAMTAEKRGTGRDGSDRHSKRFF